ncbi:MAG: gliding motility-associated C-terminal domain-containing protein [Bacteroidales bacterium]|nr:gliding motility-associated C-terminal domain-containing protein [Bacteroidales bacterium]
MKKFVLPLLMLLTLFGTASAQGIETLLLDAAVNGTVRPVSGDGTRIYDDGENGPYSRGNDFWVAITGTCDTPYVYCFTVEVADISAGDTLFIYDGVGPTAPLLWYCTNGEFVPRTSNVFASPTNTAQILTVRLKAADGGPAPGAGFCILVNCKEACESITPYIDSIFYKTHNGEVYEFGRVKTLYDYDTVMQWDEALQDSVPLVDSTMFFGVNLCRGDGVIFTGHCDYSHSTGWYDPADSTSYFVWDLGMGDTIQGVGVTSVFYDQYYNLSCYDVVLHVTDVKGCKAATAPTVRVRLAQNPLKTLFTLADICNNDSLPVNMGYDGDNATLTLRRIDFVDITTKTNDVRTFIPDGPQCPNLPNCFNAPVEFESGVDFPAGSTVQSEGDICSICVNYEHSFMGDYSLAITCPTYGNPAYPPGHGRAVLKLKESATNQPGVVPGMPDYHPQGTGAGGGRFTGIPWHAPQDNNGGDNIGGGPCDSVANPYGIGWTYCFSRNESYTLVSGELANVPNPTNAGMANGPMANVINQPMHPIPAGFNNAGTTCPDATCETLDSSDHLNKMMYYTPYENFSGLIGCPLNGIWNIEICDNWSIDNGWVFNWSLDICGISTQGCKYQVGIDSIIWAPDTAAQYHDYELGHYRGLEIHQVTPTLSYILSPDTAGTFPINVTIYDEFGCVWDTNTRITTVWAPEPKLGNDTSLCGVFTTQLDATDRHTATEHFTYRWEPFGQDTPTITTQEWPGDNISYVAQVTNKYRNTRCTTRDTINVRLRRQPLPSFMPTPFTLEGCDPLTLTFNNQSIDGYIHHWDFGDGITSELESPTHTYSEGVYDLKYYITSVDGCIDSLIYPQTIAVYSAPQAAFSWSPTYPSVTNPVINLQNLTVPQSPANNYFWELQYNQDNPLSVETLTDINPSFDYSTYTSSLNDIPGNYTVRLIARTDNLAPSGNLVYCRDTAENTVLVVNDYLTFPNVVTPNGDGINDVFIIGNLIEGMGYPNNTLDIYNRWGTLVFHKDNISSYADFWDPSNVPAGTYFYRFTARGYNGNIEHNGSIEVIK